MGEQPAARRASTGRAAALQLAVSQPGWAPYRAAAALGVATGAVAVLDPTRTHIPLCPLHALTGWWCPFCGSLRAVYSLIHGDLRTALHDNLLLVAGLPVLAAVWVAWVLRVRAGRPRRPWPRAVTAALIVLATVFCVVRNLPALAALRPQ